jgi:hypothetical protein
MTPRRWPGILAFCLLALGAAGLTGSSYGAYGATDPLLQASERRRPELLGSARGIRSDEWAVDLPLARMQQTAVPAFPTVNGASGLGHLQRNPFDAPVLDWGMVFRPHLWPLLLGNRWSHGVRWFVRSALLLMGLFAWMRALTSPGAAAEDARARRTDLAALGALAVFFSSWLTWWLSHAQAEIVAFAGLTVLAASRAIDAVSRLGRILWTAAVGYGAACAFFNFYAPAWAPVLWLMSAAILDLAWAKRRGIRGRIGTGLSLVAAVAGGVALSIAYYAPYLALIADTLYPGRRVAAGGELPHGRLVDMMWPALETVASLHGGGYRGKVPGMNVCEAACVEVPPLFLLGALSLVDGPVRQAVRRSLRRVPWTALTCAVLAVWLTLPVPTWVGYATLLRWTPWNRAWMPFGVGCAVLATVALAELDEATRGTTRRPWREVLLGAASLALSWSWARSLVSVDARLLVTAALCALLTLAGCALLARRWASYALACAWAVPLVIANGLVNPLMPSAALFRRGSGHAVIDAALRERPGRLVDYTGTMGGTLSGFGWPVLNSIYVAPDVELFRFLAPDAPGLTEDAYNRYARVEFVLPPAPSRLEQADAFQVGISPCSPRLAALGVNHLLTRSDIALPAACAAAFEPKQAGELRLWSRRDPVAAWGVQQATPPRGALDFDFSARAAGRAARLDPRRDGLAVEVAAGERRAIAVPLNLGVIDRVRCRSAHANMIDAHLVVTPEAVAGARCDVAYLGTAGGLRRLLHGARLRLDAAGEVGARRAPGARSGEHVP